jgi:hypothetical protein
MNLSFFLFSLFFLLNPVTWAYYPKGTMLVDLPKNPQSLDDFAHPNKGCPENSECDEVMGKMMTRFKDLIKKLETSQASEKLKAQELEKFRTLYGLPVNFYTTQKSESSFKPLLYNSPCRNHLGKNKGEVQILSGEAFVKEISLEKGFIQRENTLHEVPISELFSPTPVEIYFSEKPTTIYLPSGDRILFMKDQHLYVLKEVDGFYYMLKISLAGKWQVTPFEMSQISSYEERKTSFDCTNDKNLSPTFATYYCEKVWNENLKQTVPVKYYRGCVL